MHVVCVCVLRKVLQDMLEAVVEEMVEAGSSQQAALKAPLVVRS